MMSSISGATLPDFRSRVTRPFIIMAGLHPAITSPRVTLAEAFRRNDNGNGNDAALTRPSPCRKCGSCSLLRRKERPCPRLS